MRNVDISEAKALLNKLVRDVEAGATVCITRRGKAVAKLTAVETKRKPVDVAATRAVTDSMKKRKRAAAGRDTDEVLLTTKPLFAPPRSQDVFGSLLYEGQSKTLDEMKTGTAAEAKRRHARARRQ